MADISGSFWSETDASNNNVSPNGFKPGTMLPSEVEPVGQMMMGAIKRFWDRMNAQITTTGMLGAYTYTPSNLSYPSSIVQGELFGFLAHQNANGNDTFTINGSTVLGPYNIYLATEQGMRQIKANEIVQNQFCVVQYLSSLNAMVLQSAANISFYSPQFSGIPTAPTAAPGTNSTQIATTAFAVQLAFQTALPAQTGATAGSAIVTDGAGNASWADPMPTAAAGGTADAITATFSPAITLRDKQKCFVVCAAANATTAPTFSPNGLTAHTITANGGQALSAGSIPGAGFVAVLEYNSANTRWELLNPSNRQNAVATNVHWYGAVGDGSTDDTTAIQNAINAVSAAGGGAVDFVSVKTYRTTVGLAMKSNVHLRGNGATLNLLPTTAYSDVMTGSAVYWSGVYTDYPTLKPPLDQHPTAMIAINAAAVKATTITCSTPGAFGSIQAGEWIMVNIGASPKWNFLVTYNQVKSIAGDTITLTNPLDFAINTSVGTGLSIGVIRIQPIDNANIYNLRVKLGNGNAAYPFITGLATNCGVYDSIIDNWVFGGGGVNQPYANDTYNFHVDRCVFTNGNFGAFDRSSYGVLSNCEFQNVQNSAQEHGEGQNYCSVVHNKFRGCAVNNPVVGVNATTAYLEFCWNLIDIVGGGNYGLRINGGVGHKICFNTIPNAIYGVAFNQSLTTSTLYDGSDILFEGNTVINIGNIDPALDINTYPLFSNMRIVNNHLVCNQTNPGVIRDSSGNNDYRSFVVAGNTGSDGNGHLPQNLSQIDGYGQTITSATCPPTSGSWDANIRVLQGILASAGTYMAHCYQGGTFGTLNGGATTGSITTGTNQLTVNSVTGLKQGQYISIAGVTGVFKVLSNPAISATLTLSGNANATVSGAAVSYSAPLFRSF